MSVQANSLSEKGRCSGKTQASRSFAMTPIMIVYHFKRRKRVRRLRERLKILRHDFIAKSVKMGDVEIRWPRAAGAVI
jgi:hypothetical protein